MIERAQASDAVAIAGLWNEVIAETVITFTSVPKTAEGIAEIIATQPVFVARDGEMVLGFSTYSQFRGGDGYARTMEHAIYLGREAQGRGLGRALLLAVEDAARADGAHSLIAGISGENTGAVAFHGAMGFQDVGRVAEAGYKFGRFIDLILMQKRL